MLCVTIEKERVFVLEKEEKTMNQMNPLDIIDAELKKASSVRHVTNKRPIFLYLKPKQKAFIRPLYTLSESIALKKHDVYNESNPIAAICAQEIDDDCYYCFLSSNNKRLIANYRIYVPIYIYKVVGEEGNDIYYEEINQTTGIKEQKMLQGIRILELSSFGKTGAILDFFRKFMQQRGNLDITEYDFTYSHVDNGQAKYFDMTMKRQSPMDTRIRNIIPPVHMIRTSILQSLPPSIFDDKQARDYLEKTEHPVSKEEIDDNLNLTFTPF